MPRTPPILTCAACDDPLVLSYLFDQHFGSFARACSQHNFNGFALSARDEIADKVPIVWQYTCDRPHVSKDFCLTHLTLTLQQTSWPSPSFCLCPLDYHWVPTPNYSQLCSGKRNSCSSLWSKAAYTESTNPCLSSHCSTPARMRVNDLALSPRGEQQETDGQEDVGRTKRHRRA